MTLIKQVHQNNVIFVFIDILEMLVMNFNHMFVTVVTVYQWWLMTKKNIGILNAKGVDYRCVLWNMSKNNAINRLNNSKLDDRGTL